MATGHGITTYGPSVQSAGPGVELPVERRMYGPTTNARNWGERPSRRMAEPGMRGTLLWHCPDDWYNHRACAADAGRLDSIHDVMAYTDHASREEVATEVPRSPSWN